LDNIKSPSLSFAAGQYGRTWIELCEYGAYSTGKPRAGQGVFYPSLNSQINFAHLLLVRMGILAENQLS
jgi:hypothetical protein